MKTTSAEPDKYSANYQRTDFIGWNMRFYTCRICGAVVPVFLSWPSNSDLTHDYAVYLHDKFHGLNVNYNSR
jgi:hypothetical protein